MKEGPRCTLYRKPGLIGQGRREVDKEGFISQEIRGSTVQKTRSMREVGESMETESIPGIRKKKNHE